MFGSACELYSEIPKLEAAGISADTSEARTTRMPEAGSLRHEEDACELTEESFLRPPRRRTKKAVSTLHKIIAGHVEVHGECLFGFVHLAQTAARLPMALPRRGSRTTLRSTPFVV